MLALTTLKLEVLGYIHQKAFVNCVTEVEYSISSRNDLIVGFFCK
jgi:hypothetical protein